jgi:hypothetical protein
MRLRVARRDDKEKITSGSIELLEGRHIHARAPKNEKRGQGVFPAAAAAPTDPSFRDTQLNGQ